jgi:putative Mg2+ transporter-C (MgtC) family protein
MNSPYFNSLLESIAGAHTSVNAMILGNILFAFVLGMITGYERSYHGRAAGMRTYGLVCMASAAVTAIAGFPDYWYSGLQNVPVGNEPTRVIQGVVTGIGFLGAGMIMREGLNISGLTTAASIWSSAAIGVVCGSGFYLVVVLLTLISVIAMIWGVRLENLLPSRHAVVVTLFFDANWIPNEREITALTADLGYRIAEGSTSIQYRDQRQEWHLVLLAASNQKVSLPHLATRLRQEPTLQGFQVAYARN